MLLHHESTLNAKWFTTAYSSIHDSAYPADLLPVRMCSWTAVTQTVTQVTLVVYFG